MRLSAPKKIVFLMALILAVLAIAANFVSIPVVTGYQFWFMTAATILLFIGVAWKGF